MAKVGPLPCSISGNRRRSHHFLIETDLQASGRKILHHLSRGSNRPELTIHQVIGINHNLTLHQLHGHNHHNPIHNQVIGNQDLIILPEICLNHNNPLHLPANGHNRRIHNPIIHSEISRDLHNLTDHQVLGHNRLSRAHRLVSGSRDLIIPLVNTHNHRNQTHRQFNGNNHQKQI
jgi:hypothetical protein